MDATSQLQPVMLTAIVCLEKSSATTSRPLLSIEPPIPAALDARVAWWYWRPFCVPRYHMARSILAPTPRQLGMAGRFFNFLPRHWVWFSTRHVADSTVVAERETPSDRLLLPRPKTPTRMRATHAAPPRSGRTTSREPRNHVPSGPRLDSCTPESHYTRHRVQRNNQAWADVGAGRKVLDMTHN